GGLGAGKTALTQGIGAGLRVAGEITSPTFVIARLHRPDTEHGGTITLVHADAYRLESALEVDALDLDADLADSVTVVEWGAGMVEQLSTQWLEITIVADPATELRELELTGVGGDWARRIATAFATDAVEQ
ncbi:MAG: tRNA (adenosine(37)-N6)-threonylcarbamoyltransferase complex ATPase subunit type 1 TsaE, partial [Mycobacteriales bacterium]